MVLVSNIKNDLYHWNKFTDKIKYFSKSNSNFADLKDFKFEQMTADYCKNIIK